ncbi:hypothetical protein U9M48_014695 [Paspalum notatum var. saurae]|uniref:DUF1618 domain-containing protein n=1 Tax=Paspalum notatum var. saurae TaxID=547442 RepID=A0AAQ3WKR3_PASNO
MPTHRRYKGASRRSRSVRSPSRADVSHRDPSPAMRISPTDLMEVPSHGHRRSKRSSSASSSSATPYPTWVILNRMGARRDSFHGDGTTSAASCTSAGSEEIRVSFHLAKPPRTSLLVLDWPQGPRPSEGTTSHPHVIAAHRSAVLLEIISPAKYPRQRAVDYFVYDANGNASEGVRHPASLTQLPVCYWKGTSNADIPRPRVMGRESMGLLSCDKDLFIIADLETRLQPSAVNIYLFCSGSDDWRVLRGVPIWDDDDGHGVSDLGWWSTDAVLPYGRRFLIWVDYLRGMIIANMVHGSENDLQQRPVPVLRYVPLPVDPVLGNPYHGDYGRGCPEATRSLCATNHGIKFVSVNNTHGNITLFSLLENNQTWREDATLDFAQLWDLDSENRIPHVKPKFPVVDMEHPHVVCFLLNKDRHFAEPEAATWMIKVHMKKKILLDITDYSYSNKVGRSSSYQKSYRTAREMSEGLSFISTEMPCYLSAETMERH